MQEITATNNEWYKELVNECKAIITEAVFTSRWALVEGYHNLGLRIIEEADKEPITNLVKRVSVSLNKSERILWKSVQFVKKYPDINSLPNGKNISLRKIFNELLIEKIPQEILSSEQLSKFQKKVINGDCLIELKNIPDKTIDMIYVDPPYNADKAEWDTFNKENFEVFTIEWLKQCTRVLKDKSQLFINFNSDQIAWLENLIKKEFGFVPVSRIIWNYRNLVNKRDATHRFCNTYQPILHYNFGDKPLNFPLDWDDERFDVWTITSPQSNFEEGKYHITQKPLELMDRLVRFGSFEGETVLDPMSGSGTTGIACLKNNRDFILIERDKSYVDIIHKRLNDVEK